MVQPPLQWLRAEYHDTRRMIAFAPSYARTTGTQYPWTENLARVFKAFTSFPRLVPGPLQGNGALRETIARLLAVLLYPARNNLLLQLFQISTQNQPTKCTKSHDRVAALSHSFFSSPGSRGNSRPSEIRYPTTNIVIAQQVSEGLALWGTAGQRRQGRRLLIPTMIAAVQAVRWDSTGSNSSSYACNRT